MSVSVTPFGIWWSCKRQKDYCLFRNGEIRMKGHTSKAGERENKKEESAHKCDRSA